MAASSQQIILIVAPDKQAGLPLAKSLKALGKDNLALVRTMSSAIAKLREADVSLVVADQSEGSVAAFKLFQGLRKAKPYKNLPFIGVVGADAAKLVKAAAKDTHACFITKPLVPDAMRGAVGKLLNGSSGAPSTPPHAASPLPNKPSDKKHFRTLEGGIACLEECDGAQAKTIFESVLKDQGPSALAYMGLANAFLLLGQKNGYRSALERAGELASLPAPAAKAPEARPTDAPAPAEKPEAEGQSDGLHGIWHKLNPKERRQKAHDNFTPRHENRGSLRLFVPDWQVRLIDHKIDLQAVDLSATGICFEATRPPLEKGQTMNVELINRGEVVLSGIKLQVMRVEKTTIGSSFPSLSRQQENTLTHLITEEQRKGAQIADEFDIKGKKEKKVIKLSF